MPPPTVIPGPEIMSSFPIKTPSRSTKLEASLHYFRTALVRWWSTNRRDFPWRRNVEPYALLIAELMLRRTRAKQVGPVYERFLRKYPTVEALAFADPAAVAETLRPLGLEWRVPAFRQMAQALVAGYRGTVPKDRAALLSLPGVGAYVADAVRCFAYGEPAAVVDTNTVRVAGRYLGFLTGPDSRRRHDIQEAVTRLIDFANPVDANLALLDFAATICTARAPHCDICPVAARCSWSRSSKVTRSRHIAVGRGK